ncbi:MAG: amidase, partial [Rhodothermales bacterium]
EGPFAGVPFLLKDLIAEQEGVPQAAGCRFRRAYVPPRDSELVRRYKAGGVLLLGKTNTPEYGLTPFTEPALFGPTRNPWEPDRTPGGSSGGSAAAVAAGIVPMAHGNDGGGSIRIPASCCGLFGLKPTRGRTPTGPTRGSLWQGCAVEHVLTRSVRDSAAMLDSTCAPEPGAPYYTLPPDDSFLAQVTTEPGPLRIAFTKHPFLGTRVDADCVQGLEATVALLQDLGHTVVKDAPEIEREALAEAFLTMACCETAADIDEAAARMGRKPTPKDFEPGTWLMNLLGRRLSGAELNAALRVMNAETRKVGRFFAQYDVLLTPTLAIPPFRIGALQPTAFEETFGKLVGRLHAVWMLKAVGINKTMAAKVFDFIPYTPLFNITGQPATSVPLHWNDDGLPIGMQLAGRFGDETTLFRLAGQLERARPWFDRRPALCKAPLPVS